MIDTDPMDQFFTEEEQAVSPSYLLYTTLGLSPSNKDEQEKISQDDIKRAYRKSAIKYHPDKQASKGEKEKEEAVREFQKVGFAYAVLSDEPRRKRYDLSGRTSEVAFDGAEEMGWAAYFDALFTKVDKKMLDEDKKAYQGSQEEADDLIKAYESSKGDLDTIMNHIPHSTTTDEPRFITLIESLITSKELERLPKWTKTSKDENSKKRRKKEEMSEAVEAEEHAKTLGIWDEMFGEGSTGSGSKKRKSTGKEKDGDDGKKSKKRKEESGEDDDAGMAGLKAMIAKRQGARQSAMDAILDKYSKPAAAKSSGKKSKR